VTASSLDQLAAQSEALRLELEQCRQESASSERELATALRACRRAEDLLGQDAQGRPLRLLPLIWALIGGVMTLTTTFCTYLVGLMAFERHVPDSDIWLALLAAIIALSLAGTSLIWSGRQGAGGSARAVLRPLTLVLGGGCLTVLTAIAISARLPLYLFY